MARHVIMAGFGALMSLLISVAECGPVIAENQSLQKERTRLTSGQDTEQAPMIVEEKPMFPGPPVARLEYLSGSSRTEMDQILMLAEEEPMFPGPPVARLEYLPDSSDSRVEMEQIAMIAEEEPMFPGPPVARLVYLPDSSGSRRNIEQVRMVADEEPMFPKPPVACPTCVPDPCSTASCPRNPWASCRTKICSCDPEFYLTQRNGDVIVVGCAVVT